MAETLRNENRFRLLAESGAMFAEATGDLSRTLQIVAKRFAELVGDGCNIRLIDGDYLVPVAIYHPDQAIEDYLRDSHDKIVLRVGEGISGRVLDSGEPYFEPDLDIERLAAATTSGFVPIFAKLGVSGMIVARLRARGVNLGYVGVFRTGGPGRRYTDDDLHLVRDLAERAALAIDNSRLVEGLERRVDERTQTLEANNRELEAFAYSVSHDLRSPLRSIDGFAQALEEDHAERLDDDGRRMLAVIRKNAQRMSQLIEDLLRLSRTGHTGIEPIADIDMRSLAESVAGGAARTSAVPVEIVLGDLPIVKGNGDLIRQVWVNLIENAIKYSSKRGVARIEIVGQRESGEARYTVTDHGAGFDPRFTGKLFGVFSRLHHESEFAGTGVGLALVHRIVKAHGGRVWAEGQPDVGATFGFALPSTSHRPVGH